MSVPTALQPATPLPKADGDAPPAAERPVPDRDTEVRGDPGPDSAAPFKHDEAKTAPFRFRRLGGRYLITNDFGRYAMLGEAEFRAFISGALAEDGELHARLAKDGFIRDRLEFEALVDLWRRRNSFLWQGPSLHVVVVTLRCNHRCLYCHASSVPMRDRSCDMDIPTARKVVDRIFEGPNPAITIEFQGGEPLANWPVVKEIVDYSRRKSRRRGSKKVLWLNLVSNLSLMDKEKLEWLLDRRVNFCTSIDGPQDLHDANRIFAGGASHEAVTRWYSDIYRRTARRRFRIDALLTVTRRSLSRHKDIVDEYLRLGARGVYLRTLNPYGLARATWERIGYGPEEFLDFYLKSMDYILEINRKRRKGFFEQTARLFLTKILTDNDPNFLDLRSPCGAGIGQLAFNYDGGIYTCDEGRMLSRMGDDAFKIGRVGEGSHDAVIAHPAVKTLAVASCLDNQPECSQCAYKPYCGVCPIQCYAEQGDVMGRMPSNTRCLIQKGILDMLFTKLQDEDCRKIFQSWIKTRAPRNLYQRN